MYHLAELAHWLQNQDKVLIPAHADIDLTNACNQECFYCISREFRHSTKNNKTYNDYLNLLDKLNTWRQHSPNSYGTLHSLTFSGGGEPTLLPGYEKVIEYAIELGFICSLTTNGSKLDKLINSVSADKLKKMAWVGIDIDAGSKQLYEDIRQTVVKKDLFNEAITNTKHLTSIGVNVDFKILLNSFNDNHTALDDIFKLAKECSVRKIYFRPTILGKSAYDITEFTIFKIEELSKKYQVRYSTNVKKTQARNYKKCHQFFHFPSFCADGNIYLCCDNKGNSEFKLTDWDIGDFRDVWCRDLHKQLYQTIDVLRCGPCRPNGTNIGIQNILNNPEFLETLYL